MESFGIVLVAAVLVVGAVLVVNLLSGERRSGPGALRWVGVLRWALLVVAALALLVTLYAVQLPYGRAGDEASILATVALWLGVTLGCLIGWGVLTLLLAIERQTRRETLTATLDHFEPVDSAHLPTSTGSPR